jgi:hypothetical protein
MTFMKKREKHRGRKEKHKGLGLITAVCGITPTDLLITSGTAYIHCTLLWIKPSPIKYI